MAGVRQLLQTYFDALAGSVDIDRVRSLWDRSREQPFYVVDELHDPVLSWDDLEHQWRRLAERAVDVTFGATRLDVSTIAPGLAVAYAVLEWTVVSRDGSGPRSGHSRLTVIARESPKGWLFVGYVESPIHVGG